jgi:hypothetical protein
MDMQIPRENSPPPSPSTLNEAASYHLSVQGQDLKQDSIIGRRTCLTFFYKVHLTIRTPMVIAAVTRIHTRFGCKHSGVGTIATSPTLRIAVLSHTFQAPPILFE